MSDEESADLRVLAVESTESAKAGGALHVCILWALWAIFVAVLAGFGSTAGEPGRSVVLRGESRAQALGSSLSGLGTPVGSNLTACSSR
jgi:hypothetical protein